MQVLQHPVGIDTHVWIIPSSVQSVVKEGGGIGKDDAFDRGVDVPLMP